MLKKLMLSKNITPKNFRRFSVNIETKDEKQDHKKIQGWVRSIRKMKKLYFLDVGDGTNDRHVQVVLDKDRCPKDLGVGSSIFVEGQMGLAPNGAPELCAENIVLFGNCDLNQYPFLPRKEGYSPEYYRQWLHLRPRTRKFASTMRVRSKASMAIREHFQSQSFTHIDTPILTSNDCEGAGEMFFVQPSSKELVRQMKKKDKEADEVAYFGQKTYLSVSGQLHLEAFARALSKVYNFAPSFRAENSKSRLHLSEFYMVEAEIAFVDKMKDIADEAELLVKGATDRIFSDEEAAQDLKNLGVQRPDWLDKDFGCLSYDEAIKILEKNSDKLKVPIQNGQNFTKDHELFLVSHNGGVPVFVVDWPKDTKPFYAKEMLSDNTKVLAMDLLTPIVGELIGGSLREDDVTKLQAKIPSDVDLNWYLEIRKYGNVTTGGFGMGFERYLQLLLGVPNIKDVMPIPRWPHNCKF